MILRSRELGLELRLIRSYSENGSHQETIRWISGLVMLWVTPSQHLLLLRHIHSYHRSRLLRVQAQSLVIFLNLCELLRFIFSVFVQERCQLSWVHFLHWHRQMDYSRAAHTTKIMKRYRSDHRVMLSQWQIVEYLPLLHDIELRSLQRQLRVLWGYSLSINLDLSSIVIRYLSQMELWLLMHQKWVQLHSDESWSIQLQDSLLLSVLHSLIQLSQEVPISQISLVGRSSRWLAMAISIS